MRRRSLGAAHRPFQPWKVVARREVFAIPNRVRVAVETVELPDGRLVDDYVQIRVADFVMVWAETEDGRILCLRQYRHALRRASLELVAGRIDGDEEPLAAARRELLEETGYESPCWEALGTFIISPTQGIATGHIFRARQAASRREPCSGDLEEAVVELVEREALLAAVRRGEVTAGSHLAAITLALLC